MKLQIWWSSYHIIEGGLNEQCSIVRSQIMLVDPLPNISKMYSFFVQQERKIITILDESEILAFPYGSSQGRCNYSFRGKNIRGGRQFGGQGRGTRICTHCGMTNHTIDTCFKKHGYPPH